MSWKQSGPSIPQETQTKAQYGYFDLLKKPLEIYLFIDPLCPECWALDPIIKKLTLEYGRFFTIRPILSGQLSALNQTSLGKPRELKEIWEQTSNRTGMCCDGDIWLEDPIIYPVNVSLAIKAAELQGIKAGRRYLRKIQEHAFLTKTDISKENNLLFCAEEAMLDIDEFKADLHSNSAKKALQCDVKLSKEMDIERTPAIVFFNESAEDEGLKLTGLYDYDIYVKVLKQMLEKDVTPAKKPKLEEFISYFQFIGSKEIAVIYDWSPEKACKEMKKLQLKQIVTAIPVKNGFFWRYNTSNK
ncbi:putative DsbA family dithiol-disulfide isomerase [Natronobacillus azotifigens]|uniref:ClpXP adapter SpxH family protein n=1 Tax=Natronobacillus azotifigens TaxID=472978 RepID=UPI00300E30B2